MNTSMFYREPLKTILLNPSAVDAQPVLQCSESIALDYRPAATSEHGWRIRDILTATGELLAREAKASLVGRLVLNGPTLLKHYFKVYFADTEPETLVVIFLDLQMQVIATEEFFDGTFTQTSVDPRFTDKDALHPLIGSNCGLVPEDYPAEVVERALHHNASAVALSYAPKLHRDADSPCSDKSLTTMYACARG